MITDKIIKMTLAIPRDERGVTAMEYALLAGLIAMVIIASVALVGDAVAALFERVAAEFP